MSDLTQPLVDVVAALLVAVQDEQAGDIEEAADAVAAAGQTETAVTHLKSLFQDKKTDPVIRRRAALAFSQLPHPTVADILGSALTSDKDVSVRRVCLATLEQQYPIPGTPYCQQAHEKDANSEIRQNALVSLGIAVKEIVVALENGSETFEQAYLNALLGQVKLKHLEKLLYQAVTVGGEETYTIPQAAATALGRSADVAAIPFLCHFLEQELKTQDRLETSAPSMEDELQPDEVLRELELQQGIGKERVVISVVSALRQIGSVEVIPCLGNTLLNNRNPRVRLLTADYLGRLPHSSAIAYLAASYFQDGATNVREKAGSALCRFDNWQEKTMQIIRVLQTGGQQRAHIDAPGIIQVIVTPSEELNAAPDLMTDLLIEQAVRLRGDKRMVTLLAALVIASANSSLSVAGERIDTYQRAHEVSEADLQPLRVEIGGEKALATILHQLEENLETYFQKPIKELNKETRSVWRQTIFIAQIGFVARLMMSITLFGLGAIMLWQSYQLFITGQLDIDNFFGAGVPFVTGLSTMIYIVWKNPLLEIKKSVSDIGTANTVFIAYIHRISQISYAFSYSYLRGRIDMNEVERAGQLIKMTMQDAVAGLKESGEEEEDNEG